MIPVLSVPGILCGIEGEPIPPEVLTAALGLARFGQKWGRILLENTEQRVSWQCGSAPTLSLPGIRTRVLAWTRSEGEGLCWPHLVPLQLY